MALRRRGASLTRSTPPGCLPSCLAEGEAGTGTVMRPETVRRYALEAGFREVELAGVEHPVFNVNRLLP